MLKIVLPSLASFQCLAVAVSAWLATGCATVGPVRDDCARVAVDPAPAWTAAASWTGRGDRLLVVDPAIRGLLAFDLDGRLVERVEGSDLAELDYTLPIRVEPAGRTAVIGDRSGVLELRRRGVSSVFDNVPGADHFFLGDWTLIDDELIGYADIAMDEKTWRQGFVRVDRNGVEQLLELPLEPGGEYLSYHDYHQRPYVARLGDEVYVLRYASPTTVSRVVDGGLVEIWRAEGDETTGYVALLGWDDALYLVSRVEIEALEGDEPSAPELKSMPSAMPMQLQAMKRANRESRWDLVRLEPSTGTIAWRRPLPTGKRPVLAPGPRAWAVIEGGSRKVGAEEVTPTWLTLVPPDRFGIDAPRTFCGASVGVTSRGPLPAVPGAR